MAKAPPIPTANAPWGPTIKPSLATYGPVSGPGHRQSWCGARQGTVIEVPSLARTMYTIFLYLSTLVLKTTAGAFSCFFLQVALRTCFSGTTNH
ncbi:hypothetical protein LY76DRAFT_190955 [Colletotrichum caudatum]|nr:hypothetical protein LY76DRAFT_190955 [Colletotrichum caudatum]